MSRINQRISVGAAIINYESVHGPIAGIINMPNRTCLIEQLIESIHRVEYIRLVSNRTISYDRSNPANAAMFNPILASVYNIQMGNIDEAFWLIFLFTHFGKGRGDHWRYSRELYGRLGTGTLFDWNAVSHNPKSVGLWISANISTLSRPGCTFGNHRKYESWSITPRVIETYVAWVGNTKQHNNIVASSLYSVAGDPKLAFKTLYDSMKSVYRFGRTAKFDYLAMLGKTGLAPIIPDRAYISGATGPKFGGRLLFGNPNLSSNDLENRFAGLAQFLNTDLQVIEDAICNWQKSPSVFIPYRI